MPFSILGLVTVRFETAVVGKVLARARVTRHFSCCIVLSPEPDRISIGMGRFLLQIPFAAMGQQLTLDLLHLLQLLLECLRVDGIGAIAKWNLSMNALTAVAVVCKLLLHRIIMVLKLIIVVH